MLEMFLNTIDNSNTRSSYGRYVGAFLAWMGDEDLSSIGSDEVLNYVGFLREEKFAPSSINLQLAALRAFLRWAALTKRVPLDVYTAVQLVKGVKTPTTLPKPLTVAQVAELLAQPDVNTLAGARDYAFILFALNTGCRLAEAVALDVNDLDFDTSEVTVWGKGSKERRVFFDEETASALVYYLAKRGSPRTGPLFANETGARVSHRWLQRALAEYGEGAGIAGLHPHLLRHTFATWLLDASGDLDAVSKLLGHASVKTTQRYTGTATSRLRKVYNTYQDSRSRGDTPRKGTNDGYDEPLPTGRRKVRVEYRPTVGVSRGK